jgi:hypothetical protein
MQTLLTAIVTWLSMNAGLPAIHDHPRVEFAPPAKIAAIRSGSAASGGAASAAAEVPHAAGQGKPEAQAQNIEAIYVDKTRTIYLPEGWTGETPAEVSVLVHEMVHHLQNMGGLKYECPQAREKPAYAAQDRWLARSGRSLAEEFELDPMTILVLTKCMG